MLKQQNVQEDFIPKHGLTVPGCLQEVVVTCMLPVEACDSEPLDCTSQIIAGCSWSAGFYCSEISLILRWLSRRSLSAWFNFGPGHKCFNMGYTSDYPLFLKITFTTLWVWLLRFQLFQTLNCILQLCTMKHVRYGTIKSNVKPQIWLG